MITGHVRISCKGQAKTFNFTMGESVNYILVDKILQALVKDSYMLEVSGGIKSHRGKVYSFSEICTIVQNFRFYGKVVTTSIEPKTTIKELYTLSDDSIKCIECSHSFKSTITFMRFVPKHSYMKVDFEVIKNWVFGGDLHIAVNGYWFTHKNIKIDHESSGYVIYEEITTYEYKKVVKEVEL